MYGVKAPKDVVFMSDDSDHEGLLDLWWETQETAIKECQEREGLNVWEAAKRYVPEFEWSETMPLVGFFLALGARYEEDGVPPIVNIALDEIDTHPDYGIRYIHIRERWGHFADWARTQGVHFPPAKLYLVVTEVG